MKKDTGAIEFDVPASYRICISGVLDVGWSDRLEGMEIRAAAAPDGGPMTVLTGELADQVALWGVLQGLHRRGFTLLSVEKMDYGL